MIRRLVTSSEGATAVEFSLILLPFLLFVFGTFEVGRTYFTYYNLQSSANEVSRYLHIRYGNKNISSTQLVRDAESWLETHNRYGVSDDVLVSGSVEKIANVKYREITLSQPIRLLIPAVDVSFDIKAVRRQPY